MYLICNTLFVTCLLLSNIAAFKMIAVGPLTLTAAVILFPPLCLYRVRQAREKPQARGAYSKGLKIKA